MVYLFRLSIHADSNGMAIVLISFPVEVEIRDRLYLHLGEGTLLQAR
jgi:hypothetical protein